MKLARLKQPGLLAVMLAVLLVLALPAAAQSSWTATISPAESEHFPLIETYLDVHDAQGNFAAGLSQEQISILENEAPIPLSSLEELHPGAQFVIAINPGPSFGIRNSKAVSRYEIVKEALRLWGESRLGSTVDDLSLLIQRGAEISHTNDPTRWLETLATDQIDPRSAPADIGILGRAIGLAADAGGAPGHGPGDPADHPPPEGQELQSLADLAAQALEQQITINIWMVASSGVLGTQAATQLEQLAQQTGGQFFAFTGDETLPSPEAYISQLRSIYRLSYKSGATTSGVYQFTAQVQAADQQVLSNQQSFEVTLLPPQPAFVSPPLLIERKQIENTEGEEPTDALEILEPNQYVVQAVFDFPDNRQRSLTQSTLLVDGTPAVQNQSAPFDRFAWDLQPYTSEGVHQLQIQVTDSLGLTGTSIEIPVQVRVIRPASNPWAALQRSLPLISVLLVVLTGAILLMVLVVGGRLRPSTQRIARPRQRRSDPVTQPVPVKEEPSARRVPGWVNRLQWPQRHVNPQAYAFLTYISDSDAPEGIPPIPITSDEVTLGSNPNHATLVLDDPSIEALHARLLRHEDGSFRLSDEGSVAGTWVNYSPISKSGIRLEHGDLVHIGRIGFRFSMRNPSQVRKLVVRLENEAPEASQEQQE